ncbi:branched-chain amino acid transport system ATP-binding protein [Skermanella aerolata]|uniref:ABC transporter ATP-binding protein n=1 Tax=Skermanella aerolata TaxID=393310 RepID=A0A512DIR7_9PROT|nr:ABC transporter ATP-binding protein [Skermanella aerolata]KJB97428.1 ABC transporter ATP-binding protein [Skermanella aerolata KACC 11604]GEO36373.1 ABC transporter ATP-binding protein [Skermanella aerolata]
MALLELISVTASYGAVDALNAVSLRVEEGEIVTLLGANGAGKTTTLRTISGLMKPRSGSIRFLGKEIAGASANSIVRLGLSHVPEGRRIFPGLTVRENILLGSSNRSRVPKAELDRDLDAAFGIFPDILKFADAPGWTLSGGQQQMVAVARGLMARPKLLMLDEPSLGLAPIIVQQVFRTIAAIRERGTTVLLVEQNAHMALSIADRGYVLETGRLIVEGPPATLLNNEEVRAAYLGGRVTAG